MKEKLINLFLLLFKVTATIYLICAAIVFFTVLFVLMIPFGLLDMAMGNNNNH